MYITSPHLVKNGLFSFSYFQFTLTCSAIKVVTIRKLSDFEWLRNKILQLYPSIYISPIPQLKYFKKNKPSKWNKRVYLMQSWFNTLIKTPVIRSSQLFYDFITVPKEEFRTVRHRYDKIQTPKSLSKMTTSDGILKITVNPYMDEKANKIIGDINKKNFLYNKLNTTFKELMVEMNVMAKKMSELSNVFHLLSYVYKNSEAIENDKINNGLIHISNVLRDWSRGYQNQVEFFQFEMKYYFRFMSHELNSYNYVITEYQNARGVFMDLKGKTVTQKERDSITKYYGFYMNKVIEEYERLHNIQYKRMKLQFELIESRKNDFISDYSNFVRLINFKLL